MNNQAINEIVKKSKRIFVEAWIKERTRLENIEKLWKDKRKEFTPSEIDKIFNENVEEYKLKGIRLRKCNYIDNRPIESWFVYSELIGKRKEDYVLTEIYNRFNRSEYNRYQELTTLICKMTNGTFKKWLKQYRNIYYTGLIGKFISSAEKYIKDFKLKENSKVEYYQGPKGYEINAEVIGLDGKEYNFNSFTFGAGGYNIQRFHYRYKCNLKN